MEHPPTWPKCPACIKNNPIPSKSYAFLGGSLAILTPLTMKTLHSQNGQEHASVWKLSIPILYGYGPWFIYGGLPMDFRGFYVGSPMDLEVPSIIFSPKYGTIVGFSKALSFFVKLHVLPSFRPRFSQVFWSAARLRTFSCSRNCWRCVMSWRRITWTRCRWTDGWRWLGGADGGEIWLVVWNMNLLFHRLGRIIPTDFHIFQRGWNHQPDPYIYTVYTYIYVCVYIIRPSKKETPYRNQLMILFLKWMPPMIIPGEI